MTKRRTLGSSLHNQGTLRLLADCAAVDRLGTMPKAPARARLEAAVGPALVTQLEHLLGVELRPNAEELPGRRLLAA
jgi:hypothetical protein